MKKPLFFAAMLSGALMFAADGSAESNDVEVKLTIDRSAPATVTYNRVLEEAARVCLKDTHCEAALTEALVAEIDHEAVSMLHAQQAEPEASYQIASAD